jgi:hypothetical protein
MLDAMVGDSGSGGTKGLVPAPAAGDAAAFKFLMADGTWVSAIPDTIAAFIYLDTDQALTDNVEAAIAFTDEVFDTGNLWASSPNPTRLTVPSDGIYAVRGKIAVNASFVGVATVRIYVNGTMAASVSNAGQNLVNNVESHEVSALLDLTAGDYLELKVLLEPFSGTGTHDVTGGNSTVTTFAAFKVASQGGGSGGGGGATIEIGTEAARPPAGTDERLYLPTDGSYLHEDDSIEWRSWGPIYPQTMPTTSGFSLVNGSGASATLAANGRLILTCTGVGNIGNVIMYVKTAPATPWSFIVRADAFVPKRNYLA